MNGARSGQPCIARQGIAQQWPESDGFGACLNRSIEAPIFVNTGFSVFLACQDG
ncbi:MAG: hypothetical protein ACI9C3_002389 [Yoonia sp.]|jgi:hypothetical protein